MAKHIRELGEVSDWEIGTTSEIEYEKDNPFGDREVDYGKQDKDIDVGEDDEDEKNRVESESSAPEEFTDDDQREGGHLHIVSRQDWAAEDPTEEIPELSQPIRKVSFHYNTGTDECYNIQQCERLVQEIQQRHIAEGYPDIQYNFLVGNDGNVYEGRGWNLKPEIANKYPACEDYTIEVAYIGFFETCPQDLHMFETAMVLINWGVYNDIIHKEFSFVGYMEKEVDYSKEKLIQKIEQYTYIALFNLVRAKTVTMITLRYYFGYIGMVINVT